MTSNMLNTIVEQKYIEIKIAQQQQPLSAIRALAEKQAASHFEKNNLRDFTTAIKNLIVKRHSAVIAEIKKASPSKGIIRENFDVSDIARAYSDNGAACLSVLTDEYFFKGHANNLKQARAAVTLPILRKDFIINLYQVYESALLGADCILLIAAILETSLMEELLEVAHDLNMAVLVEVHNQQELGKALALRTPLLGINNRNLQSFDVSIDTTIELAKEIQQAKVDKIIITESGIENKQDVKRLKDLDIHAFLIGETLMRASSPGKKLKELFFS